MGRPPIASARQYRIQIESDRVKRMLERMEKKLKKKIAKEKKK
jgi:hypothetical protein